MNSFSHKMMVLLKAYLHFKTKDLHAISIERIRRGSDKRARTRFVVPGVRVQEAEVGGLPGLYLTPKNFDRNEIILYLHGGGFCFASPATHRGLVSTFCKGLGMPAFIPKYPLAPENPFPIALDGLIEVYREILCRSERIVLMGDSAGGNLALGLYQMIREQQLKPPVSVCLLSPWLDLKDTKVLENDPMMETRLLARLARDYAGKRDLRDPLISPFYADLSETPPMLLTSGSHDSFTLKARELAIRYPHIKHYEYEGMCHVFEFFYLLLPEARKSIRNIIDFVRMSLV